jgi:hypothetical protein
MTFLKNRKIDQIINNLREGEIEEHHAEQELDDLGVNPEAAATIIKDARRERETKWSNLGSRLIREHVFNATNK